MSNSRRLLAAGLAAAVVGSMGVVWTLGAEAAETPAPDASVVVAEPVAEPGTEELAEPPPLLPWGDEPTDLTVAKAGASSATVAAVGADAAAPDLSGSLVPEPEYAPKGRDAGGDPLMSMETTVVPPTPPGAAKAVPGGANEVNFHYAVGTQFAEAEGTWANLTIEKPILDAGDYHSLAEIAVQSADGKQAIEVGWTVDRSVNNGSSEPHLFVYYWKDDVPGCYNCDFQKKVDVGPGFVLPKGHQKRFGIRYSGGNWWIAYDSVYLGYFKGSLWDGKFTKAGLVQWFGEVAVPKTNVRPCTQMGNGVAVDLDTAARIGSITLTNGPEVKFEASNRGSAFYRVDKVNKDDPTNTAFRYSGPFEKVKVVEGGVTKEVDKAITC